MKVDDNAFPKIITAVQSSDPAAPVDGSWKIYSKSGGIYARSSNSVVGPFAAPTGGSAGALVFLEAHSASASTSLDFTTFVSATYDTYKIEGLELILATSTADLRVEMGVGGGPTWDTGNFYEWASLGYTTGGAASNDSGATGIPRIFKSISTAAGYGFGNFSLTATALQSTTLRHILRGDIQYVNSAPAQIFGIWGMHYAAGAAVTGIRFIASSGNITSGTIRIYGVAKS